MKKRQKGLWNISAWVEPRLECDKIGITSFELGAGEVVIFKGHVEVEDKTKFCVTVNSDSTKVNDRAKFILKAFLAPLELEYKRSFAVTMGVAHLIKARGTDKEISEE